jgi:sec-independent protein translocase protein TatC
MSYLKYWLELKIRLIYSFIMLLITVIVCYIYKEPIIYLLIKPLINTSQLDIKQYFIFTNLIEIFIMYLKITFIISLYLIIPFILYQIWLFLIPGLYLYEKIYLKYILLFLIVMLYIGILLTYFIIIPFAWNFFLGFETKVDQNLFSIQFEAKINEYLLLILNILLTVSFCFQLPIFILLLIDLKLINIQFFYKKRKIAYIIFLIMAAMISPPDLISQILLVIPLIFFYEVIIFYSIIMDKYKNY